MYLINLLLNFIYTFSSASFKSAIISSTCSMPTEIRTNPSVYPLAFRSCLGTSACVMVDGWVIIISILMDASNKQAPPMDKTAKLVAGVTIMVFVGALYTLPNVAALREFLGIPM